MFEIIIHQIVNSHSNYNYNTHIYSQIQFSSHFHKNYELIYVFSGIVKLILNSKLYELSEGELFLISPYTIHSLSVVPGSKAWIGVFSEDYIPRFAKKNNKIQYSKFKCDEEIENFLKKFLFYEGQSSVNMTKGCLYIVCSECRKNAKSMTDSKDSALRGKVIDFISKNLSSEVTLAQTAQALGYEYHYFSSLFHQHFEMNFKEFINVFKIEYASELLLDATKSIAFVALECGFQSVRNFNRVFKNYTGQTPTEYRRNLE